MTRCMKRLEMHLGKNMDSMQDGLIKFCLLGICLLFNPNYQRVKKKKKLKNQKREIIRSFNLKIRMLKKMFKIKKLLNRSQNPNQNKERLNDLYIYKFLY